MSTTVQPVDTPRLDDATLQRVMDALPELYTECSARSLLHRAARAFRSVTGASHCTVRDANVARRRRPGMEMVVVPVPNTPVEARLYFDVLPPTETLAAAHKLAEHLGRALSIQPSDVEADDLPGPTDVVGWLDTDQGPALVLRRRLAHPPEVLANLTDRQLAVALLTSDGMTNLAVAEQLGVSVNTVANHLRSIFRELGITSREELAKRVMETP